MLFRSYELILKNIQNNQINYVNVKRILKKNKLNEYYKHINYMCDELNNQKHKIYVDDDMRNKILYEFHKFEIMYKNNKILD